MLQHKRFLSFYKKIFAQGVSLLCCLLLLSNSRQQQPGPLVPAAMARQLQQYRAQDNLAEWIYRQVDWVNEAPAARAVLLRQATGAAWRAPRSDEEMQAWQHLLVNQGYTLLVSGDIVHSTDAYLAAFQWARQHRALADDSIVLENILKPLGNNYTRLGDYEQALFIQHMALQTAQALRDKHAIAGTWCNLSATASSMGQPEQSLQYCRKGLEAVAPHTALYGLLLSEQAEALARLQQHDAAGRAITQSIRVLAKKTNTDRDAAYWLLTAYQQAGDIYEAQPQLALQYYNKALALQTTLLQQHGDIRKRERARLFYRLGKLHLQLRQYADADNRLQECLGLLLPGHPFARLTEHDLYGENTLMDVLFTRAGLAEAQQQTTEALRLYSLCFATEKKLRNEFITGASKEREVADSRRRYEIAINGAFNAWQQTRQPFYQQQLLQFIESSKAQLLLDELQQQQYYHSGKTPGDSITARIALLEKALVWYQKNRLEKERSDSQQIAATKEQQEIEWELAGLRRKVQATATMGTMGSGDSAFSPASLMALLNAHQRVRSFFIGVQSIYTIELGKSGIGFADRQPAGQTNEQIQRFVQQYFQHGAKAMINHPKQYYGDAYAIYDTLFGRHPLQAGNAYILLPDGAAATLPVEALVISPTYTPSVESWPFMLGTAEISYAYSMQTLKEQLLPTNTGKGFTGFFIEQGLRPQADLQAVAAEQQGIAQTITGGSWRLNDRATAAAFREALAHSAVVHISAHAFAKNDSTDAPHIQLYDEPFYLFELKNRQQHPAMVVLSACQTGNGRLVSGDGVQSMARAFIANGTNAVVAAWWNVDDAAAAQIMQQYYASLAGGITAAGALREAKLNWIENKQVLYQHKLPYYWAALNYYGHPAPLRNPDWMKARSDSSGRWWLLLLLLPVTGGWIFYRHRVTKHTAPRQR
jgi:hypothetical protein